MFQLKVTAFLSLLVFSNLALATDKERVKCYPLATKSPSELCVPSIGNGGTLYFTSLSQEAIPTLANELTRKFQNVSFSPLLLSGPDTPAEEVLLQNFPQKFFIPANGTLGKIGELFNKSAGFGGPNCYTAAIAVTNGSYSPNEFRYTSPEEFELTLQFAYDKVSTPQLGDIVVYEASSLRGHAAVYLADGLIFHKKSFGSQYIYRITAMTNAADPEPFEWEPMLESAGNAALKGMETNDRAYYRKRQIPILLDSGDPQENLKLLLIDEIGRKVSALARKWDVSEKLGMATEALLDEITSKYLYMKDSPSTRVRMAYARLISYRDQVFQSIENERFSSRMSSSKMAAIYDQICYNDTLEFRSILAKLLTVYGKRADAAGIDLYYEKLKQNDRKVCRLQMLSILNQL